MAAAGGLMTPMFLGAHMSIAGGVDKAILRGDAIGCTAIQIFLKYNTRWRGKPISQNERAAFFANQKKTGLTRCIAHNCYLINLASPDDVIYAKSLAAMLDELERAAFLRIGFLVIHPGSHRGSGEAAGIKKIAHSINLLLEKTKGFRVKILLETVAGQGTGIGYRFEQLADIIGRVKNRRRIGVCLDTAHIFAAGYDIRTKATYEVTIKEFDRTIGLKRICAFHLNDSKKPLGSRIDRHEHIGHGFIGLDAFRFLLNDERFSEIPQILETPKGPGLLCDVENLRVLKSLIDSPLGQ